MSEIYDLRPVSLPRLAGGTFSLFVRLLESRLLGSALTGKTLSDMGIPYFRDLVVTESPVFRPTWPVSPAIPRPETTDVFEAPHPTLPPVGPAVRTGFLARTAEDFANAYRSGQTTPEEVAEKALAAITASDGLNPPLRAFLAPRREEVMAAARASSERWKKGRPFGLLDGVPVGIKDELDLAGYPTTVGTRFLGTAAATEDAHAAGRLRAAGALLLGKTNMHEIGIGVTGFNRPHGTARNPHAPGHYTGGSSSGSAAAVAAGLCPVALSADAGGSIRIPAALCGVVGLKPTYGRVSSHGGAPLAWSLDHYGPIAATVRDAALAYALMGGHDPRDRDTRFQPPLTLSGLEDRAGTGLGDLSIGIFRPWFEDAAPEVVKACRELLEQLVARGAKLVEIGIPDLRAAQLAHLVTVASEMATSMAPHMKEHLRDFGLDVRANLALARAFTAGDYVKAQRVRARTMAAFQSVLEKVDVIVTPATGVTAPAIRADVLPDGESDLTTLLALMRFVFPSNLTGHPAISFPAGYDPQGLPVGMQLIGRPWHEHVLLRVARAAEPFVERKKPQISYDLLG